MFSYDNIQKFNDTEMGICRYITANADKIPFMTIRELAEAMKMQPSVIVKKLFM